MAEATRTPPESSLELNVLAETLHGRGNSTRALLGYTRPVMLTHTFIHIDGVGPSTEAGLWRDGVLTWDDLLDRHRSGDLAGSRIQRFAEPVRRSRQALEDRRSEYFAERLPGAEMWRLYPDFKPATAFLDIETTGLSPNFSEITMIGLFDGRRFQPFVMGRNLADFPGEASRFDLLVSFNGARFDLPFLRAAFPLFEPRAHLDLRFPLARLGYTGGLKNIERMAGIRRPIHIADVDGYEAVRLWHRYRRGDVAALETLVEYCRYDVESLCPLAELTVASMKKRLGLS